MRAHSASPPVATPALYRAAASAKAVAALRYRAVADRGLLSVGLLTQRRAETWGFLVCPV